MSADHLPARPSTATAPAEYLKVHKIRDKLFDLTRALAINQPRNPDRFLRAMQHLVERDALRQTTGGSRRLPHERATAAESATSVRAAVAGGELASLLVELEQNAASLASLSCAILPHIDNGFAQCGPVGSQGALVEALRSFEDEAKRALQLVQGACVRPQHTVAPSQRQGDAGRPVSALAAVAASGSATDSALRTVLNSVHGCTATGVFSIRPHIMRAPPRAALSPARAVPSRVPELPVARDRAPR